MSKFKAFIVDKILPEKKKIIILAYSLFSADFFINPLPDDKILDWSKFKNIADNI